MIREKFIKIMRGNAGSLSVMACVLRYLNSSSGYCRKCGLPWNWCKRKTVMYSNNSGYFATCQYCWNDSRLEKLKQYYTNIYRREEQMLLGTKYTMKHTLDHLLKCVEDEYNRTHGHNKAI